MRLLYKIARLFLLICYYPSLHLTRKFPKYWGRLKLYRFELYLRFQCQSKPSVHLAVIKNDAATFKMLLRTPGKIEDQLLALGTFESHLTNIMHQFMEDGFVFIDVGANIGFHTLQIMSRFPNASAFCFEPNPEILSELSRNTALNGWQSRVEMSRIALSDKEEQTSFYVTPAENTNRGMSSLEETAVSSNFNKILVETKRFDDFWKDVESKKRKRVSVVKIDTQGHEESVINGMLDMIRMDKPTLFLEFETELLDDSTSLVDLYKKLESEFEYEFFIIQRQNMFLEPIKFSHLSDKTFSVDLLGISKN